MSTGKNLNLYHKTRLQNCKGRIEGDTSEMKPTDFVHWCPTKKVWLTSKADVQHIIVPREQIKEKVFSTITFITEINIMELKEDDLIRESLYLDSLGLVKLIIQVENDFGISIPDKEKDQLSTIKDLIDLVDRKLTPKS